MKKKNLKKLVLTKETIGDLVEASKGGTFTICCNVPYTNSCTYTDFCPRTTTGGASAYC
jgi:hypothetical protein